VTTDDLYSPLGLGKKPARFSLPPVVLAGAAGALGIGLGTFAIWVMVRTDPFGGEPMAVARVDLGVAEAGVAAKLRPSQPDAAAPENTGTVSPAEEIALLEKREQAGEDIRDRAPAGHSEQIVTIIDGRSGARQEVKIPAPTELGIAPAFDGGIVEMTRDGPIPRVGANGMRAAIAYAQPSGAKPTAPQIAIVVTGIGTPNAAATEAMNKLPAAVTLAFVPGGSDLERLAGKARSLGHELLLQVPMEPAEQNPAPQALLASLPPDQNIKRLHWLMSRFQGYVGIAGRAGGRSTTLEAAFAPILREITNRGLIYVDDGSSGVAKANLVLDAVPSPAEIDRALAKLEGLARQNGAAIGFATASPAAIERIARWSKALEGRGFSLVPITAAAARGKPS
jgi:polysaccharide deacetylase 2 family uncharacterized protein YibQ